MSENTEQAALPIAIQDAPPVPLEDTAGDQFHILARYPSEMRAAQGRLAAWADAKVKEAGEEVADLEENYQIAVRSKWGASAIKRALTRAVKREEFHVKIKLALDAGYCIVPDFPVDLFAIRVKRKNPAKNTASVPWNVRHQESATLPAGEGEFKSDEAEVWNRDLGNDARGVAQKESYARYWRQIEFPFTTAKPAVLKATERAMADKFFDELGALPRSQRRGDPIIVGRIKHPEPGKDGLTFLVYWFIDLRRMP